MAGIVLLIVARGFFQDVVYGQLTRFAAISEHLTHYPPGLCRVLNVKALHGSGEVHWIVAIDQRKGEAVEHIRVVKADKVIDNACPENVCAEKELCGVYRVEDYRAVPAMLQSHCSVDRYEAKREALGRYLSSALMVDRVLDMIFGNRAQQNNDYKEYIRNEQHEAVCF